MDYQSKFCAQLVHYFRHSEPTSPPSLAKFAALLGVSVSTLRAWARAHSEFGEALDEARLILQDKLIDWGLNKLCDATFAKFLLAEPNALWPEALTDTTIDVHITVSS
ncbi:MAG: hypothetical protein J6R42_04255 [Clostridia bacterium]|nr:hypothetical protein [Clostridia bacterium]